MQLLTALLIADEVRQRAEQGDCPTIHARPVETLEEVVMELQRALARDAVAGAIVEVKAERDALREQHSWRPISSAPKDGTDVMVGWCHIDSWFVTNAFWMDGAGVEPDDVGWWSYMLSEVSRTKLGGCAEPTHWMPRIAPPIS